MASFPFAPGRKVTWLATRTFYTKTPGPSFMASPAPLPASLSGASPLLRVRELLTSFHTDTGTLRAVDGVSFDISSGQTLGIVGESGCGKSVTALSILRLVPTPAGRIESGSIEFRGKNLLEVSLAEMHRIRGNQISMIFQEPMTSLNPVYTAGTQIAEAIRIHEKKSRREARVRALEMLRLVGIPSPETNIDAYPHQLSGGMRQRVMIAMALACRPSLLIADEPTTALDVTVQAQILTILANLQRQFGMSIILITHDLGVVAEYADHVLVMYAGRIVEQADVRDLFAHPRHPYTRGLLQSIPRLVGATREEGRGDKEDARVRLKTIEGMVPDLRDLPSGCRFADRCPMVVHACSEREPDLSPLPSSEPSERIPHLARCIRAAEV
jgi:peptide/nickel transport system ATP-binding protein